MEGRHTLAIIVTFHVSPSGVDFSIYFIRGMEQKGIAEIAKPFQGDREQNTRLGHSWTPETLVYVSLLACKQYTSR
jgi:hypothetical protein